MKAKKKKTLPKYFKFCATTEPILLDFPSA